MLDCFPKPEDNLFSYSLSPYLYPNADVAPRPRIQCLQVALKAQPKSSLTQLLTIRDQILRPEPIFYLYNSSIKP